MHLKISWRKYLNSKRSKIEKFQIQIASNSNLFVLKELYMSYNKLKTNVFYKFMVLLTISIDNKANMTFIHAFIPTILN